MRDEASLMSLSLSLAKEMVKFDESPMNTPSSSIIPNSRQRIKDLRQKIHDLASQSRRVKDFRENPRLSTNRQISQENTISRTIDDPQSFYLMITKKIRDEVFKQLKERETVDNTRLESMDNFYDEELEWRNSQYREILSDFRDREAKAKAKIFEGRMELSNHQLLIDDLDYQRQNDHKIRERLVGEIEILREKLRELLKERADFEEDREKIESIKNDRQQLGEINQLMWTNFLKLEAERDFLKKSLDESAQRLNQMNRVKFEDFEEKLRKVETQFCTSEESEFDFSSFLA